LVCGRACPLSASATSLGEGDHCASDFAVCRGKYTSKQGDSSHQICTCKAAALETAEHIYFECTAYDAVRLPLPAATARWCELSYEDATNIAGLRNALLWAATDSALLTPNGPNPTGGGLWQRALELYAKASDIRHNKSKGVAAQPTPPV
jgi:hypothetical protein